MEKVTREDRENCVSLIAEQIKLLEANVLVARKYEDRIFQRSGGLRKAYLKEIDTEKKMFWLMIFF